MTDAVVEAHKETPPVTESESIAAKHTKHRSHCSFCGKSQDEVRKLIAGTQAFICNECIALCVTVLLKEDV